MRRLLPLLCLVAALAGCGGSGDDGEATLWVTRDRGAEVLVTTSVPTGVTAMQALRSEADVDTSYGGRFVQSIEGVAGDADAKRDWFYFVNGVEADRGAAEYRLRPGDVLWWDYRSWAGDDMREPVVVGAFPEPFLHGYDGRLSRAVVRFEDGGHAWNGARPRAPDRRRGPSSSSDARGARREPARSHGRRRDVHGRAPLAGRHGRVARPLPGLVRGREAPAQGSRARAAPLRRAAE